MPAPCKLTGQPVTPPSQPGHLPRRPATKRGLKGRSRGGQGDGKRLVKDVKSVKDCHGLRTFLPAKPPCEAEEFLSPFVSSSTPKNNNRGSNQVRISEQITVKAQ